MLALQTLSSCPSSRIRAKRARQAATEIGGTALAQCISLMELILRRCTWALYALVVALGAYLVASTVNIFATAAIAPGPALPPPSAAPQAAGDSHRMDLAAERIARLFDVPLPKGPARADPDEEPRGPGVWNWIPIRSSLHGTLIGTAIADPPRYSL